MNRSVYTFTGREYDPESGLYFYRARYYDPRAGRFLTKDPIGFLGGDVNLYRYVWNSPTNWVDPEGLQAIPLPLPGAVGPLPVVPQSVQLSPEQWKDMKEFLLLFNPVPFYDYITGADRPPDFCEFGRGKGDKYGPLWKAPGMPGWKMPSGDFNKDGYDYWKKPSNWHQMTKWEKTKWYLGKIGGALGKWGAPQ